MKSASGEEILLSVDQELGLKMRETANLPETPPAEAEAYAAWHPEYKREHWELDRLRVRFGRLNWHSLQGWNNHAVGGEQEQYRVINTLSEAWQREHKMDFLLRMARPIPACDLEKLQSHFPTGGLQKSFSILRVNADWQCTHNDADLQYDVIYCTGENGDNNSYLKVCCKIADRDALGDRLSPVVADIATLSSDLESQGFVAVMNDDVSGLIIDASQSETAQQIAEVTEPERRWPEPYELTLRKTTTSEELNADLAFIKQKLGIDVPIEQN